ncbi:MAG: MAPEG family protein [Propylenella sp.]
MEPVAEMPTEIVLLGWTVVLLLVQLVLHTLAAVAEFGLPYSLTSRDEGLEIKGKMAGRLTRAFQNLLETFPAFAAVALALAVSGKTGGLGAIGAHVWFWARLAYVPFYAFGIQGLRTAAWAVSVVGIVLMVIALLA